MIDHQIERTITLDYEKLSNRENNNIKLRRITQNNKENMKMRIIALNSQYEDKEDNISLHELVEFRISY